MERKGIRRKIGGGVGVDGVKIRLQLDCFYPTISSNFFIIPFPLSFTHFPSFQPFFRKKMAAATPGAGELLFAALDNGDMGESNDVLDRHPGSVDARDEELRVPLHYAADCADLATFQRILNMNRALMDAQDQFGFTPLLVAVMAGNRDVLEYLIEQGAQLSQLDRDGHSAVHWAVVCGQLDALIALLRHGAPLALADIHGAHPLHYSTVRAPVEEEQMPAERAQTILHVLLRHGAQLEATDLDGRTPLLWTASDGQLQPFLSLIQAGANRFAVDRDRLGVLHCAASHGHADIVREMLSLLAGQNSGSVDAKDRNADTPLFYAATYGHWECAKLLLEKGANANHLDKRIRSAAHCAAAKGQLRVLKLLRQFGASFDLQNYRGDLPFHEAVQTGSKDIVEWLLDIDPQFVSAPNFFGRTALHLAASSGNLEMAVLLCMRGAPVDAMMLYKGEQLMTPLDVAKRRKHDLVVHYLSGRHEAREAREMSAEKRHQQRSSIEEWLSAAKLRKIRGELMATTGAPENNNGGMRNKMENGIGQKGGNMVDASTMVSRRSSSASGIILSPPNQRWKVPKATSTTDLANATLAGYPRAMKRMSIREEGAGGRGGGGIQGGGGRPILDKAEMERTIQRIVQEELERAKENDGKRKKREGEDELEGREGRRSEEEEEGEEGRIHESGSRPTPFGRGVEFRAKSAKSKNNGGGNTKRFHLATDVMNGAEEGEENERTRRIRRHRTPRPMKQQRREEGAEEGGEDEEEEEENGKGGMEGGALTELHILEQGLRSPGPQQSTSKNTSTNNTNNAPTRRYIHEKAIFDELTHLKRMQIQYGKVREQVLVRSLVQNFCRMHAIHPSHFRHICTFHQWEKFLYDQLKMIYLEERDRISAVAAAAAQRAAAAAGAAGMAARPGALYSAQQRVFAPDPQGAFGGSIRRNFEARAVPRTNTLEQRMHELNRIYGSDGRSSRNSATAAKTDARSAARTITAKAVADVRTRGMKKGGGREGKGGRRENNGGGGSTESEGRADSRAAEGESQL